MRLEQTTIQYHNNQFIVKGQYIPIKFRNLNIEPQAYYLVMIDTTPKNYRKILSRINDPDVIIDIEGYMSFKNKILHIKLPPHFEIETWWGEEF